MQGCTSSWLVVSVERRLSSRTSNSGATPKQITQTQTRAVSGHYDRAGGFKPYCVNCFSSSHSTSIIKHITKVNTKKTELNSSVHINFACQSVNSHLQFITKTGIKIVPYHSYCYCHCCQLLGCEREKQTFGHLQAFPRQ
ncbi:hypothetical protein E2C01_046554 [Portunus trituberculatus]|uniref:Uncharacterized protein n=1 Tax=Portunus trituberculatus TaxID=210409 RepID=A0A5B7G6H1_PORTR|nr:hypothetical protein [Portunus trituberculatus]